LDVSVQCQTAQGSQTLDKPGYLLEGAFFLSIEYRYMDPPGRPERGRYAGPRGEICAYTLAVYLSANGVGSE
jgi:hypothetical protein